MPRPHPTPVPGAGEPQPLLFLLPAPPLARLCLAFAPDPPGSQQGGGWGAPSVATLSASLAVSHRSAPLSWQAPGCQCRWGFLAASPAGWSLISGPRVRERRMNRKVCRGHAGVSSLQAHVQSWHLQGPPLHTLQVDTCPAAACSFHCREVPLASNPNTSSCRTRFGLSLSARVQLR